MSKARKRLFFVFDDFPGGPNVPAEFVELENEEGRSLGPDQIGEWLPHANGTVALVIPDPRPLDTENARLREAIQEIHRRIGKFSYQQVVGSNHLLHLVSAIEDAMELAADKPADAGEDNNAD